MGNWDENRTSITWLGKSIIVALLFPCCKSAFSATRALSVCRVSLAKSYLHLGCHLDPTLETLLSGYYEQSCSAMDSGRMEETLPSGVAEYSSAADSADLSCPVEKEVAMEYLTSPPKRRNNVKC